MPTNQHGLKDIADQLGLAGLTDIQLLQGYGAILEELRARGISRTSNNPVADYAEWLVCSKLHLKQEGNSNAGYDAVDDSGLRYEIKARRVTPHNQSVQLSAIRQLDEKRFDYLIGIVFELDFSMRYAAKLPHALIGPNSHYRSHTNAHVLHLTPSVLKRPGVELITSLLSS